MGLRGPRRVEIALPRVQPVRSVVIYWSFDGGKLWSSRSYAVQAFVNGTWQALATATSATPCDLSVHEFAPVQTDRLRILQADGGGPAARPGIVWLREIEVY